MSIEPTNNAARPVALCRYMRSVIIRASQNSAPAADVSETARKVPGCRRNVDVLHWEIADDVCKHLCP